MNAFGPIKTKDTAVPAEPSAKIDIFKPAVEGQCLVKANSIVSCRGEPHSHVAAIAAGRLAGFAGAGWLGLAPCQRRKRFIEAESGAANSILKDMASCHHDIGVAGKGRRGFLEIAS